MPACTLAMAAAPGFSCASWAAVVVLVTSIAREPGKCLASQLRHCDRACGRL